MCGAMIGARAVVLPAWFSWFVFMKLFKLQLNVLVCVSSLPLSEALALSRPYRWLGSDPCFGAPCSFKDCHLYLQLPNVNYSTHLVCGSKEEDCVRALLAVLSCWTVYKAYFKEIIHLALLVYIYICPLDGKIF